MLLAILEYQRHRLFLWTPVMFGTGIGVYFWLWFEPESWVVYTMFAAGLTILLLFRPENLTYKAIQTTLALTILGYSYAAFSTIRVAAPVLERQFYYGPIEGTIIGLDRSASNAARIMLDDVYLPGIASAQTPAKIRVSLQGLIPENTIAAGARVTLTGSLSPPGAPVEPGGFDFRRMAYFMQLGAVGYTRNPVIPAAGGRDDGFQAWIFRVRMRISEHIQSKIEGQNGAFASAILTGDRSGIDPEILADLRAANLAHLLAISGLHMGLLSGFVFGMLRYGLALVPRVALRIQPKKLAAGAALCAGFAYLLLSGANVATQRAFIMTAVVLVAVMLDRPAFTLRAVALAAFLVLIIKPYSLVEAGFQMSFAATTALIGVYEWLRGKAFWQALNYGRWRWIKPVIAVAMTSAVAGVATAPISAFHFNQISQYGLAANVLAVPAMGLLVMPSAVIAALFTPFGFDDLFFRIMGEGIGYILRIAAFFTNLEGSTVAMKSAAPPVLALIGVGGLFLALWRGRGSGAGLVLLIVAAVVWIKTERPAVFISEDGKLFGVMVDHVRVLSKERGNGYTARIWLENDGDRVTQAEAYVRDGIAYSKDLAVYTLGDWRVVLYSGKDNLLAAQHCQMHTILILPKIESSNGECIKIDAKYLQTLGATAITFPDGQPQLTGSREAAMHRPWGH